jgi:cytochrome c553
MPGGVRQCVRCHGNEAWHQPAPRSHASASVPVKTWTVVCGACHDTDTAQAHIAAQTSASGMESCAVCHGPGRNEDVAVVHPPK